MRRVLVTGAHGLLGCSLVAKLEEAGWFVVRHGRSAGDVCGSLADLDDARRIVAISSAQYIVNLAALTDVDRCESHPNEAYLGNTRIAENLAAAAVAAGASPFIVHISTDQMYDGRGPHREEEVTLTNYYGFSKYAAELAMRGAHAAVLRTNFFGPSRCPGRNSFSDWLVNGVSQGKPLRVFNDIYFSPLSLETLCVCISKVLEMRLPGTFNLGSHGGMTKADFCFALARALNLPTDTVSRADSKTAQLVAYRPKDMRMDSGRFETAFGMRLPTLQSEIDSMKGCYRNVH